jgi:hypothetical protein
MKVYEVVKDHKSGLTKVRVREERRPSDPLAGENLRRLGIEKRARVASLKRWWVALRYAWRDRAQRMRIVGHSMFFAAMLVFPLTYAILTIVGASIARGSSESQRLWSGAAVLLVAIGTGFVARSAARRLFGRKS